MNKSRFFLSLVFLLLLGLLGYFSLIEPKLDRNWSLDQSVPSEINFLNDDQVEIKNIRNFIYASTTSYTPRYYDRTVNISTVESVDFIVEPFGNMGAAHTFLSFGLADGSQIAISIEIRKEVGESFSPWKGIAKRYELMYVIADERDVVNLRANHRKNNVYLYPSTATKEEAQALFLSMVKRAQKLSVEPEFYNTVVSNCTTNIVDHVNELREKQISWDYRMLFPEYADTLAKEYGLIVPNLSIEEARARYRINEVAEKYRDAEDFSQKIRERQVQGIEVSHKSGSEVETGKVLRVIDGDTLAVEIFGKESRVRLIGLDAPEVEKEGKGAECFAEEATEWLQSKLEGRQVTLKKDVSDKDKYDRLLRFVYLEEENINLSLVALGYAREAKYEPDVSLQSELKQAENNAQEKQNGFWKACY